MFEPKYNNISIYRPGQCGITSGSSKYRAIKEEFLETDIIDFINKYNENPKTTSVNEYLLRYDKNNNRKLFIEYFNKNTNACVKINNNKRSKLKYSISFNKPFAETKIHISKRIVNNIMNQHKNYKQPMWERIPIGNKTDSIIDTIESPKNNNIKSSMIIKTDKTDIYSKIEQITKDTILYQQSIKDRIQSSLWLYKNGNINVFQVLYCTQLMDLTEVPSNHDVYLSPRDPISKSFFSKELLELMQKEDYLPQSFIMKIASKERLKNTELLLKRIGINVSTNHIRCLSKFYMNKFNNVHTKEQNKLKENNISLNVSNYIHARIQTLLAN